MSSLQKFHRRTQSVGPAALEMGWPATAIGGGDLTHGFWLGGPSSSKIIVSPGTTSVLGKPWGSYGTLRGVNSTTNGSTNTNTLYGFGSAAHPAAYYCKTLTTGGYNTWYLPAVNELISCVSNKAALPFAANDAFGKYGNYPTLSSTENNGNYCRGVKVDTGQITNTTKHPAFAGRYTTRAVRITNV